MRNHSKKSKIQTKPKEEGWATFRQGRKMPVNKRAQKWQGEGKDREIKPAPPALGREGAQTVGWGHPCLSLWFPLPEKGVNKNRKGGS